MRANNYIEYKEGEKIGEATFLKNAGFRNNDPRRRMGLFQCPYCDNKLEAEIHAVKCGNTKSCGCLKSKTTIKRNKTHGWCGTTEYTTWQMMKSRCYNTKNQDYYLYGGRGIKVCRRWVDSFESFIEDMGKKPSKELSIERRDSNADYGPDNCYWGTLIEQANNKRRTIRVEYKGEVRPLSILARELGVFEHYNIVRKRIKSGWPVERAVIINQ